MFQPSPSRTDWRRTTRHTTTKRFLGRPEKSRVVVYTVGLNIYYLMMSRQRSLAKKGFFKPVEWYVVGAGALLAFFLGIAGFREYYAENGLPPYPSR